MSNSDQDEVKVKRSCSGLPVTCDKCRFWDCYADTKANEFGFGYCHRHAPVACIGKDVFGDSENIVWPQTRDNDWCGEFESDDGNQRGVRDYEARFQD
jgi:hypothetical protein